MKPEDEGGGLSQGNSVVRKENRKSWDYYGGERGKELCILVLPYRENQEKAKWGICF